jgi:hypothetical protein
VQSQFVTTSWSLVLAARGKATSESRQALEQLCRSYWYPLYAFVRSQGFEADEARDHVQGYFVVAQAGPMVKQPLVAPPPAHPTRAFPPNPD